MSNAIGIQRQEDKTDQARLPGGLRSVAMRMPMLVVLAVTAALLLATVDNFGSYSNLANMARLFAPLLVASVGITFVFLIGGIDLSIGSVVSLASVVCALAARETGSVWLGCLSGVGCGMAIGVVNGTAVAFFRLPAFVHTLAMLLTVRSIGMLVTGGNSVGRLPLDMMAFGRGSFLMVPNLLWIAAIVFGVSAFMLARSSFGRSLYLIGTSERAALFSGVNVPAIRFAAYFLCSTLAGLAGVLIVMRLGSGGPAVGDNLLLMAIAAVVLGGSSIMGGDGSVTKTLVGASLIILLDKGLNQLGFEFYDQAIIMGAVIILGSSFSMFMHRRGLRR